MKKRFDYQNTSFMNSSSAATIVDNFSSEPDQKVDFTDLSSSTSWEFREENLIVCLSSECVNQLPPNPRPKSLFLHLLDFLPPQSPPSHQFNNNLLAIRVLFSESTECSIVLLSKHTSTHPTGIALSMRNLKIFKTPPINGNLHCPWPRNPGGT